jgi:hypothetical protein
LALLILVFVSLPSHDNVMTDGSAPSAQCSTAANAKTVITEILMMLVIFGTFRRSIWLCSISVNFCVDRSIPPSLRADLLSSLIHVKCGTLNRD